MIITLKELHIENFKGCKDRTINFGDSTDIRGANASGKTTLEDAFVFLLFGTDSTGASKFQVRPKDKDGNLVHNVEIKVEATLYVDGEKVVLSKVQREKWVKKRGSDVRELQGNENLYEINGYPKSEKDYNAYIKSLMDEDLFKLLTNPLAFPALPWKKQREILMQLADETDNAQMAEEIDKDKYAQLIPELKQASTDDIRAKYTKAMSVWKEKQRELPARIDEVSKLKVDVDITDLEAQKASIKAEIEANESELKSLDGSYKAYEEKIKEKTDLEQEIATYRSNASKELSKKHMEIISELSILNSQMGKLGTSMDLKKTSMEQVKGNLFVKEQSIDRYTLVINESQNSKYPEFVPLPEFDESTLICPTCGQDFPEDVKAEKLANYAENVKKHKKDYETSFAEFEKHKKETIDNAQQEINKLQKAKQNDQSMIDEIQSQIESVQAETDEIKKEINIQNKSLNELPTEPDFSQDQKLQEMEMRLAKLDEVSLDDVSDRRTNVRVMLTDLQHKLIEIEQKISDADNSGIEERIEQLKEEQRSVGQKVADQEKMIYLLESFIRDKMDRISEQINSKFQVVNFQLFETQLNGGISETCKITKDGVAYADINSAGKIQAGMDVINTLQKVFNVTAPIWIDNRESVTELPDMNCQIINMYVDADYKELKAFKED